MAWRDEYLEKAKEAESQAEKASGDDNKAAWLRIAAGYDDLAAQAFEPPKNSARAVAPGQE
jgi:hypothetical protein